VAAGPPAPLRRRRDPERGARGAGGVADPHLKRLGVGDELAEVVREADGGERARSERSVEEARIALARRQRAGDELVDRVVRREVVPDELGVVDVAGEEDHVPHGPLAQRPEDQVALVDEPRPWLARVAEEVHVRPPVGVAAAREHPERHR